MGNNEYDENFFKQLDIIENNVLDGLSFDEVTVASIVDRLSLSLPLQPTKAKITDKVMKLLSLNIICK